MSRGVAIQHRLSSQEAQAVALLHAGAKTSEIAIALGVTQRTVQRILKRQHRTVEEIDKKLSIVQRELKQQMPIRERVETLVNVARTSELDFAKISSVKYLNELDGIHPKLEREKVKRDQEKPQTQPMFILPGGTSVHITVNQTPADSVSAVRLGEVVDVAPEPDREE